MSTLPHPADPKRERGLPKLSAKQDVPEDVDWSCHVDHKLQLASNKTWTLRRACQTVRVGWCGAEKRALSGADLMSKLPYGLVFSTAVQSPKKSCSPESGTTPGCKRQSACDKRGWTL